MGQPMTHFDRLAPFSAGEKALIDAVEDALRVTLGSGCRPDRALDEVTIRAEVLRALILKDEGAPEVPPRGLRLRGATITGTLDLQGCDITLDISLSRCLIENEITLVNANMRGLYLSECHMEGLSADNAVFDGALFLRSGTVVQGEVSLSGAVIRGDIQICDAVIENPAGDAIFAPSITIDGSLFLGDYPYGGDPTTLVVTGGLFFSSARIAHDVFVTNTAVGLPADAMNQGVFTGSEEHGQDMALSLARAQVGGILYLKDNQISKGIVNLAGASVARLGDEPVGPGSNYPVRLDGFRYTDFSRHAETSLEARLAWLERRPADLPFIAQPYEQLAEVLSHMGHRGDARSVLLRKEVLLRADARRELFRVRKYLRFAGSTLVDGVFRVAVGYGYRPGRAVLLACVLIAALGWVFQQTWEAGDMTPNAAPILVSSGWTSAVASHPENPGAFWSSAGQAGQDWETFHPVAYAADVVIPIVDLGQEGAWAPSTARSDWGRFAWWLRWFAKAIGWIVTALAAGAITGIIRSD